MPACFLDSAALPQEVYQAEPIEPEFQLVPPQGSVAGTLPSLKNGRALPAASDRRPAERAPVSALAVTFSCRDASAHRRHRRLAVHLRSVRRDKTGRHLLHVPKLFGRAAPV